MCIFEFDEAKSEANRIKHGIDFYQAQDIWDGFAIQIPARTVVESRLIFVGEIANKYWSAVVTEREGSIRIISVRRARKNEVELYEGERF